MENKIIVIDTDVIINHFNGTSFSLSKYLRQQKEKKIKIFVSVVTLFEFYSGQSIENQLVYDEVDQLFKFFTIQPVVAGIAKIAAEINRKQKLYGKIGLGDLLIGSTALYLDSLLITENKKHFKLIPNLKFAV